MAVARTLDRVHSTQNDTTKSVVVGGRESRWFNSAVNALIYPWQPNTIARTRESCLIWAMSVGTLHAGQPQKIVGEPNLND
jgi:hypothetical protein